MDQLSRSCDQGREYPKHIITSQYHPHVLDSYCDKLSERENFLFAPEAQAKAEFWEHDGSGTGYRETIVNSLVKLKDHCNIPSANTAAANRLLQRDPRSRFVFLHAKNARAKLYVTRDMLTMLLSYQQVMPSILDFIFSFGKQQHAQDFHFGGFRQELCIAPRDRGLTVPTLGRSGRTLQMCYSLGSVEFSQGEKWPWSIRQAATYHSFDLESGNSFWLLTKGNTLMRDRIKSVTQGANAGQYSSFDTPAQAFNSALSTHLVLCDWAGESWRWYINYMEEQVQGITRKTLDLQVRAPRNPMAALEEKNVLAGVTPIRRRETFKAAISRTNTKLSQILPFSRQNTGNMPQGVAMTPLPATQEDEDEDESEDECEGAFSFEDLQSIQKMEEKANEALLVLRGGESVLSQLKETYCTLDSYDGWPYDLAEQCKGSLIRFRNRVGGVEHDLRNHQGRLETLIRLLSDRKALLYGILEYRSMEASKLLAERAQKSADHMEQMTREMHEIAVKTKQETVSMRIITLVTLFFLPGTFICTLMSTDIIQFQSDQVGQKPQEVFSIEALRLFFIITAPLMVGTFMAWYMVYLWVNHREKVRKLKEKVTSKV